jgi:hypothetical protein
MKILDKLTQFRTPLYRSLPGRGDASMDLLDSLSSNQGARSVVEFEHESGLSAWLVERVAHD